MIQDIYPSRLDNHYVHCTPESGDTLLVFDEAGKLLADAREGSLRFPVCGDFLPEKTIYLFSVDGRRCFLAPKEPENASVPEAYQYRTLRELRGSCSGPEVFAAFTGWHLWRWYRDTRCCGRCGGALEHQTAERSLKCRDCGNVIYPRINPAVIVGVTNGDSLLLTRYRTGFAHNALVAGFTEIGETLEQTVEREVMEETGIRVKNIRYYKSQPWGIAQDILVGFFCEADGSTEIRMDTGELKYAEWVRREDIVLQPDNMSLTNEMMTVFRDGKI